MDLAAQLQVLQAAQGDPALLALATVDLSYPDLPVEEREAIKGALLAAAVPHWCDPLFLAALSDVEKPQADRLFGQLCSLKVVELFPARGEKAVNVHASARLSLREHLRQTDPEHWRTLAERARVHLAADLSVHCLIESQYHLFAIDQETAAAECDLLDRDLSRNPAWEQALSLSLTELVAEGWLSGSAMVEALLIPLMVRLEHGETVMLKTDVIAIARLAQNTFYLYGLAKAQIVLGKVYENQGGLVDALDAFQFAFAILDGLAKEDSKNLGVQKYLAIVHGFLGRIHQTQGRLNDALFAFQQGMKIMERESLADPTNVNLQGDLAGFHASLGNAYASLEDWDMALESFRLHKEILERIAQNNLANTTWQRNLGAAYALLGAFYARRDFVHGALAFYQRAVEIFEQVAQLDQSNLNWQHDLAAVYIQIGWFYKSHGDRDHALDAIQRGMNILGLLSHDFPGNLIWRQELAAAHTHMGWVYEDFGRMDDALREFEQSLAIIKPLTHLDPANLGLRRELGAAYLCIGTIHQNQDRSAEATDALMHSLAIYELLAQECPDNEAWKHDLEEVQSRLRSLMPMDAPRDQFLDLQWGLESFVPSLQQLNGEDEFLCPNSSEAVNVIDIALMSETKDFVRDNFWYAFWYIIKECYLGRPETR